MYIYFYAYFNYEWFKFKISMQEVFFIRLKKSYDWGVDIKAKRDVLIV